MFPLLFPHLENILKGMILLAVSPRLWTKVAATEGAEELNTSDRKAAMAALAVFTANPSQETFQQALDAGMSCYFCSDFLEQGRKLLASTPFPYQASTWWQNKAAEIDYNAQWIPEQIPTLIINGQGGSDFAPYFVYTGSAV
jgi:hypothetical protein